MYNNMAPPSATVINNDVIIMIGTIINDNYVNINKYFRY